MAVERFPAEAGSDQAVVDDIGRLFVVLAEIANPDLLAVTARLQEFFAQPAGEELLSIDAVMGLSPRWRSDRSRRQRDAALTELADKHFPFGSGRQRAREVEAALHRYETTAWPRDHRSAMRPDGLKGACYDVLLHGEVPGYGTLRALLATTAGVRGGGSFRRVG